jgi:hypothetical protein
MAEQSRLNEVGEFCSRARGWPKGVEGSVNAECRYFFISDASLEV